MQKPTDDSYRPPSPNFYFGRGEVLATRANLPHWNKALTCCFATFRLADSLPREELLKRLERSGVDLSCEAIRRSLPRDGESEAIRRSLLREDGGEADSSPLGSEAIRRSLLRDAARGSALQSASYSTAEDSIQDYLDAGHGSCVLRDDACRQVVENSLWHFAGERYHLYAYVVMPNHVHVLFQPMEGRTLSRIVADWKSFTAHKINELLGTDGVVWQKESFDTLIRGQRHFQTVISYIRKNDLTRAWVVYH